MDYIPIIQQIRLSWKDDPVLSKLVDDEGNLHQPVRGYEISFPSWEVKILTKDDYKNE